LKPWPKGVSGNPGGRPKKKAITEELDRLLEEESPNGDGKTWAVIIAEALLKQAAKGDVRAITELANRIEGKPVQPIAAEAGRTRGTCRDYRGSSGTRQPGLSAPRIRPFAANHLIAVLA